MLRNLLQAGEFELLLQHSVHLVFIHQRIHQPAVQSFFAHERSLIDHRANRIRHLPAAFAMVLMKSP